MMGYSKRINKNSEQVRLIFFLGFGWIKNIYSVNSFFRLVLDYENCSPFLSCFSAGGSSIYC